MTSKITATVGLAAAAVLAAGTCLLAAGNAAAATLTFPSGFTVSVVAPAPDAATTGPDDIARLGNDLFVAYQNGVGSKGEPASSGTKNGTVVEYTLAGAKVASWSVTGKIDGLGADPDGGRIIATVNEDGNSSLYVIDTAKSAAQAYTYTPALPHGGGTDSVVEHDHKLYITASAPAADSNNTTYSQHALYEVTLAGGKASWKSVFEDNSTAKDLVTSKDTKLNLSDPDSSENVPAVVPKVGGSLLLDSQGDKQLLFLHDLAPGGTKADLLNLNTQVDDTTFATKPTGTLYVVDSGTGQLLAITGPFTAGQAFVSVPKDSDSLIQTLGSLDLTTGKITAWGTGFGNPKGLLFTDETYVPPTSGSGTPSTSPSASASASPTVSHSASATAGKSPSAPATTPTTASAKSGALAHTGADNTLVLGGAAVGLLVVGGGVLMVARRRRSNAG